MRGVAGSGKHASTSDSHISNIGHFKKRVPTNMRGMAGSEKHASTSDSHISNIGQF